MAAEKAVASGVGVGVGVGVVGGTGAAAPVRPEASFEALGRPSAARATAAGQESITGVKVGRPAEGGDSREGISD
jgi:hypothetical protein